MVDLTPIGMFLKDETYVPLERQFSVLYGLNGAGKSLALEALTGCLTGHVLPRGNLRPGILARHVPRDYSKVGDGEWPPGMGAFGEWVYGDEMEDHFRRVSTAIERTVHAWSPHDPDPFGYFDGLTAELLPGIVDEMSHSLTVVLRPTGAGDDAEWRVSTAVLVSDSTPDSFRQWHRIRDGSLHKGEPFEAVGGTGAAPAVLILDDVVNLRLPRRHASEVFGPVVADDTDVDEATLHQLMTPPGPRSPDVALGAIMQAVHAPDQTSELDLSSLREALGIDALESTANRTFAILLRDAPPLRFFLKHPSRWIAEPAGFWGVPVPYQTPWDTTDEIQIPLADMSRAEQRWARVAISLALAPEQPRWLVIDEPEAALHRAAESHMAVALASMDAQVIVATHSPELLDERGGQRLHVSKSNLSASTLTIAPFTSADHEAMESLGLLPSDLLRRDRAYLLVEGEHDLQILEGWFGESLARAGVRLLPLRGARRLKSALDAQFLFGYTDAAIIPFLDDLDTGAVQAAWTNAVNTAKTQQRSDAIAKLRSALRAIGSKTAVEFLEPFLTGAIARNVESRVTPLGVQQSDILDYLPVQELVPTATDWATLRDRLRRDKGGTEPSETEFKDWLRNRHNADLSPENLRRIADSSPPHPELVSLIARVHSIAASRRG